MPPERDQRAHRRARPSRRDGGAAQGRRSDHLRPRHRGDRRLPRGGVAGRDRPRHPRRAGRRGLARLVADRANEARRVQFVTGHGADGKLPRRHRLGRRSPTQVATTSLHAAQDARRIRSRAIAQGPRSRHAGRRHRLGHAAGGSSAAGTIADIEAAPRPFRRARRSPSSSAGSPAISCARPFPPTSCPFRKHPPSESPLVNAPASFAIHRLTHLEQLEAESIHIMREVVAETERPVMLYSVGKDQRGDAASRAQGLLSRAAAFPSAPCRHDLEVPRHVRASRPRRARERHGAARPPQPGGGAARHQPVRPWRRSTPTCGRPKG